MAHKKRVLFLCTENSDRSQMAEGILRRLAGRHFDVYSAGIDPKGVHPMTIDAMKEVGIDVSLQTCRDVKEFEGQKFDYVITVCDRARQQCPVFPGSQLIHFAFDESAEESPERQEQFLKQFRDELFYLIRLFLRVQKRI
jgi:arsenate reductase